ncbi:pantoate--beta-alanine ligase [Halocynthiibacter namhaensis]|uniref:pantoate--beta-alanine ligase n=1 Tax=Halocynthiibacter namhaensis TaxID=1290553 RepID=UPI0005799E70|nr:pantoate--beta-alanine ligase [Halocynthiibacter namhaensis]
MTSTPPPQIIRTLAELREITRAWKRAGETIGVVPTMGALHDGHLSLAQAARNRCDRVIVTIFVNPKQFNNPEDLANYPRTEVEDAGKLAPIGADLIWVPGGEQMYPTDFTTNVSVGGLTDVMEGAHRPGHFDGVATVVAKLFLQTKADQAFFGEKDFQQLMIVTRMARDLDIDIDVVGCPTIREETGLAMSSRNLLLSDRAALKAATLHEVMTDTVGALAMGADFATLQARAMARLQAADFTEVEYFEMRARDDFTLLDTATRPARLFAAAWMAGVRLIDNIEVPVQG